MRLDVLAPYPEILLLNETRSGPVQPTGFCNVYCTRSVLPSAKAASQ
jgi:hypothetical protein